MPSSPRSGASSRRATAASTPPSTGSRPRATSSRSREVRGAYAGVRANERAEARGEDAATTTTRRRREGRRPRGPPDDRRHGRAAVARPVRPRTTSPQIDALAATYVVDGAALEVLRLTELAAVYRAYEDELARRGALDFGEQIAAVTQLFKTRPNVLRRWQRQFRYILVDEFQDANVAQIELIELLGRTPDRPDNVMVVGDDDQSIYRFRGASFAAFAEFDARFSRPPAHDPTRHAARPAAAPPDRAELPLGRPRPDRRQPADRQQRDPLRARQAPDAPTAPTATRSSSSSAPAPEDEAVAIVDAIKSTGRATGTGRTLDRRRRPVSQAQAPRGDRRAAARRGHPVHRRRRAVAVRDARDPRPRAGAAGDRRPARRRRAGPDDDRRSVAARRARDPAGRPGRRSSTGRTCSRPSVRSSRRARSRSTSSTSGARTGRDARGRRRPGG